MIPAIIGEVGSKVASNVTGIPETVFDAVSYINPTRSIVRYGAKVPVDTVSKLAANALVDTTSEIIDPEAISSMLNNNVEQPKVIQPNEYKFIDFNSAQNKGLDNAYKAYLAKIGDRYVPTDTSMA